MVCPSCGSELETSSRACRYCGYNGRLSSQSTIEGETAVSASPGAGIFTVGGGTVFAPGSLLCRGRYRLVKQYSYQQWAGGAYEIHWHAQDLHRQERPVTICELSLPQMKVAARQTSLSVAMRAFFAAASNLFVPALIDVFRDQERDFFVFSTLPGESLLERMQRTSRTLQEQEAVECCLQVTESLLALSQQQPPLVHGLISPRHIFRTPAGHWYLANFSLLLACGARQYLEGLDAALLSPFTALEFPAEMVDSRADLYALLATMAYAISGTFSRGERLQAHLSPSFAAIFMRGLHPAASQRYQHPSQLYQDLLACQSVSNPLVARKEPEQRRNLVTVTPVSRQSNDVAMPAEMSQRREERSLPGLAGPPLSASARPLDSTWPQQPGHAGQQEHLPFAPVRPMPDVVAQTLSSLAASSELQKQKRGLLPRPEDLPPFQPGNDRLAAVLWLIGIVLCAALPVVFR
ncbi:MAG: hypothetical protein IMW89_04775 [Ktedonobacteraceae bacterium]|nr:hypothetical protein [Ktedonobacteraceae bacterium]